MVVDMCADQFLFDNGNIVSCIDLDAYVIGPVEWELSFLKMQIKENLYQILIYVNEEDWLHYINGEKQAMSKDSLFMVKTKDIVFDTLFVEVEQMDLVQIGKFIAELRKEQKLTQEQLGEKIGVTNKTISRWENGNYLPPADMLLTMSQLFDVSVNEILSGKRLLVEEYKEVAEANLVHTLKTSSFSLKERIDFYKTKWLKEHIAVMVLIGVFIIGAMLAGIICKQGWLVSLAVILLPIAHCWRNNAMMTYVEKNAYDGNWKN